MRSSGEVGFIVHGIEGARADAHGSTGWVRLTVYRLAQRYWVVLVQVTIRRVRVHSHTSSAHSLGVPSQSYMVQIARAAAGGCLPLLRVGKEEPMATTKTNHPTPYKR